MIRPTFDDVRRAVQQIRDMEVDLSDTWLQIDDFTAGRLSAFDRVLELLDEAAP